MYLRRLDIKGFKSFADKIELEFGKGITAVVGPNGSGKSNIADSIRWVLGEQSAKTLRGGKMEDVIFAGTENRKALGCAEVALTIDNSSKILPLDYSEVTIARRLYRSGESEYLINNVQSRLKDVVELFMDTGIGKDGYSLIGQGKIDEIINSRSDERRNIFEEAAGIVKYKTRKQEAEKRLENTKQNLVRVTDIIGELEEQIEPLSEQSKKAKEYLNLKEELKGIEINLIIHNYESARKKLDKVMSDINELTESLETFEKQKSEYHELLSAVKVDVELLEKEYEKTGNDRFELEKSNENKEGNLKLLYERLEHYKKEEERLKEEIELEDKNLLKVQEEFSKIQGNENILADQIEKHKSIADTINTRYLQISEKSTSWEDRINSRKSDLIQILKDISQINNKVNTSQVMLENLNGRKLQLQKDIDAKREKEAALNEQVAEINEAINQNKQQLDKYIKMSSEASESITKIEKEIENVKAQKNTAFEKLKISEAKYRTLSDMEREMEGFTKSVKSVISNYKDNKRVFGTVSDLIKVPKGYEVAMEISLGAAIQNIVVNSENTAAEMISYLKKNVLGRATFLPMDTIKERAFKNERECAGADGYLGIASDIAQYDLKFKGIVSSILGRVIICDNLSNAQKLARKLDYSCRIVTLDGDVINAGGSFTGGSTNLKNNGIFSRKNEIESLSVEIESRKKELQEKENIISEKLEQASAQKSGFESINNNIQNINIKIKTDETHIYGLEREKEGICEGIEDIKIEIEQIEMQLESNSKNIAEYEKQVQQGNAEHLNTEKEIEAIQNEYKFLVSDKENVLNELTKEKIVLAEKNKEIEAIRDNLNKLIYEKDIICQRSENCKKQVKQNENRVSETNSEIETVKQQLEELHKKIEDIKIILAGLEEEKKTQHEKREGIEKVLAQADESITLTTNSIHKLEINQSKLESEIEVLQNKLWDDYELTIPQAQKYRSDMGSVSEAVRRVNELKSSIRELGEVNVGSIEEFKRVTERYSFLTSQKDDLIKAEESLNEIIEEITLKMKKQFEEKFEVIRKNFNDTFKQLFGGGFADLKMEDDDILNCGIDIIVQPPGKKLQSLTLLSGGEKGLAAIALIFAILKMKPTPFCVLDEIEASLDDANVNRFAEFLVDYSNNTQFIIITHRKGSMAVADALYGITMEEKGVSKSISLKLSNFNK